MFGGSSSKNLDDQLFNLKFTSKTLLRNEKKCKKNEKDFKPDSSVNLKERGILKYKIQSGRIEDAREYLIEKFPKLFE